MIIKEMDHTPLTYFAFKSTAKPSRNYRAQAVIKRVLNPPLMDSCRLITQSRDEILRHTSPQLKSQCMHKIGQNEISKASTRNYPLRKKSPDIYPSYKFKADHFLLEEAPVHKEVPFIDRYRNNEKLSAIDISEGVIYNRGGIGFNRRNSKQEMSKRNKQESLETIKSLETAREDSSEVESSAQIVYTQPVEEIWPKKGSGYYKVRIKTKPDDDRSVYKMKLAPKVTEEVEVIKPNRIIRPYVGRKISTKSEKDMSKSKRS